MVPFPFPCLWHESLFYSETLSFFMFPVLPHTSMLTSKHSENFTYNLSQWHLSFPFQISSSAFRYLVLFISAPFTAVQVLCTFLINKHGWIQLDWLLHNNIFLEVMCHLLQGVFYARSKRKAGKFIYRWNSDSNTPMWVSCENSSQSSSSESK